MPDEDPELPPEVYAAYGLAMYHAQRLELTLVKLLLMFRISVDAGETYDELKRAVTELFQRTMGFLHGQLPRTGIDLTSVKNILEAALKRRNFLAHDYFRERPLRTFEGYKLMLEELADSSVLFQDAKNRLDTLITENFKAQGISVTNLLDQRKAIVITADGYLVGNGSVAQVQISRERGQETLPPTLRLHIEWEKATEDERARLLRLADVLP
jgi:hypothetical protein